ncbi:phospholipase D-like domain-containing protein [Vibrio sp.]|uniref:phospholipase D-like domain-containing protein n=1 Tax=Vibrio sp. TaxID=678 RepID=UPI003D0F105D
MNGIYLILVLLVGNLLAACSTISTPPDNAIRDTWTEQHMENRRWRSPEEQQRDYIKLASESSLPIQDSWVKVIGTDTNSSIQSLADKIYLIEHAKYSIDLTYYIFSTDIAGSAMLGALCEAVQRGVDIRIMVDSLGSFSLIHEDLKGLKQCENKAGYVKNESGNVTTQKARVQVVVFNAMTKWDSDFNRRSHDKLLIVDGAYPKDAVLITGGRNISVHYYAIDEKALPDPGAFKDIEIILKPSDSATAETSPTQLAEYYYSILFSKPGNKNLTTFVTYKRAMEHEKSQLEYLKNSPAFKNAYQKSANHLNHGFSLTQTRFAHELDNLINENLVSSYSHNKLKNANSISGILGRVGYENFDIKKVRIVSPYLFLQSDLLKDQEVISKNINVTLEWLDKDPDRSIEIITNSVLTSDNFFTQAVIDMHTAPQLLMTEQERQQWLDSDLSQNEENQQFINSESWQKLINHPRIIFYQLGKSDAVNLGGSEYYGKLHAKFVIADDRAFVGTTNLDFRSLLYNNEMGFFLLGGEVIDRLNAEFDLLQTQSNRWGSKDWLEMRHKVREVGGMKGFTTNEQRAIYKSLENTGLIYQF